MYDNVHLQGQNKICSCDSLRARTLLALRNQLLNENDLHLEVREVSQRG